MFNQKIKTMKLSDYVSITKNEYVTVQIIPSKSNRNNNTDAIAKIINKMFLKANQMFIRENKKLIINTQMKASYYIHIAKSEVQFYFIIPKVHLTKFKTKFVEVWKNIEIKEVDKIPVDLNNGTKYQLNYKYNDALSLDVDKRSNELLNANLSTLEILDKDEYIGIFYNFIPTGERESNYFNINHSNIIDKYKKGYNLKKSKNVIDIGILALRFLIGFIDDFISDMQKDLNKKTAIVGIKRDPSPATIKKATNEIIKTQIIITSKAENKEREKTLLNSVSNSFKSISDDNELIPKEIKKDIDEYKTIIDNVKVNYTTVEEAHNFISLAGNELINQYKVIEHKQIKENPVPEELKSGIVNLGEVKYKGNKECGYLSNDKSLQSLPLAIMGGSRSGKSTFSINMCKNIIDAGEGLIVIDFIKNTELAEQIKSIVPTSRLIEIDLSNPKHIQSLAYNEIKLKKGMNKDEILIDMNLLINYQMN